jgi:hypothetical protein
MVLSLEIIGVFPVQWYVCIMCVYMCMYVCMYVGDQAQLYDAVIRNNWVCACMCVCMYVCWGSGVAL